LKPVHHRHLLVAFDHYQRHQLTMPPQRCFDDRLSLGLHDPQMAISLVEPTQRRQNRTNNLGHTPTSGLPDFLKTNLALCPQARVELLLFTPEKESGPVRDDRGGCTAPSWTMKTPRETGWKTLIYYR